MEKIFEKRWRRRHVGKGMGALKSVREAVTLLGTMMSPPYDE